MGMARHKKKSADTNPRGDAYYYAGGRRVELTPADDLLAIDERRLSEGAVPDALWDEPMKSRRPLTGGISLVDVADLGGNAAELTKTLKQARALQPVYRADGAILVALPEVRVEESRPAEQRRLEEWLEAHAGSATVESRQEGRVVLKPPSGYGGDAVALANHLAEEVKPEMAQPRFLRVTPRPFTMRG
jgi:hypothetical protein